MQMIMIFFDKDIDIQFHMWGSQYCWLFIQMEILLYEETPLQGISNVVYS